MSITKNQFDILTFMEKNPEPLTQRTIANAIKKSVGTVNKIIVDLTQRGFVNKGEITPEGVEALQPYRVKRAVFIAAGFGSRMVPITLNTPKPLVKVNGVRIIDTLLDAVVKVGIEEIYIVRGYLSEQFDQLLYKYKNIKFIENPIYNESNNISSVLCARYLLKNAYVFEADLLLYNPNLIEKYQYSSNYLGVPVDSTDDWCFQTTDGYISKFGLGGENCYHMFGVSYWSERDGGALAEHLDQAYRSPGGKERYWDQVPLEFFIKEYKIAVRECTFDDIVEIDTFRELKALDPAYGK